MRILHLIPGMAGGGAERQVCYLCGELVRRGCEVYVALHDDGPNTRRLEASGAQVVRLPCRHNHDPMLLWRIAALLNRLRPDLVHTWLLQMDVLGGLAARMAGRPWILSERCSRANYPCHWKHRLRERLGRKADLIIANSQGGADYWRERGAHPDKVAVIRNGIPFREIDACPPGAAALRGERGTEKIVFAGRFVPQKNLPLMLEALRTVLAARPAATIHFYGEGPLLDTLTDFRARHGLGERMHVGGYVDPIWGILKAAAVMVSVSRFEGTPNIVLESAAAGCPMVLSDIPAHREILDEESAMLVSPQEPSRVAAAILQALEERAATQRRTDNARRRVSRWSIDAVAEEHLTRYRAVIGSAGGRS